MAALWDALLADSRALVGAILFVGFLLSTAVMSLAALLRQWRRRSRSRPRPADATPAPDHDAVDAESARIVGALMAALHRQRDAHESGDAVARAEAGLAAERAVTLEEQNQQLSRAVAALTGLRPDWPEAGAVDRALAALATGSTGPAEAIFRTVADGLGAPAIGHRLPPATAASHRAALVSLTAPDRAVEAYEAALALDDRLIDAWNQLGLLRLRAGELERAQAAFRTVLALGDLERDRGVLSAAVGNLGLVARGRGDLGQAEESVRIALVVQAALGDRPGMARQYANLGQLFQVARRYGEAETCFGKALELEQALGRRELAAGCHSHLAMLAEARGRPDEARRHWQQALVLYERLGMGPMVQRVRTVVAGIPTRGRGTAS